MLIYPTAEGHISGNTIVLKGLSRISGNPFTEQERKFFFKNKGTQISLCRSSDARALVSSSSLPAAMSHVLVKCPHLKDL